MSGLELSVVMPTFNRIDTLRHVLPTLLNQSLPADAYEIIIADSGSSDGTAEYVSSLVSSGGPTVRYLPGEYTGRASARNAGILASSANVVMFTDADILASRTLLERHAARHRVPGGRRVAVVGCELQVVSLEDYRRQRDEIAARKPLHPATRRRLSWLYFLTGNASVRRDDLVRAGSFDEQFTGYGHEDLELGYRLQKSGVELLYEPEALNFHWHPVAFGEQVRRMELAGVSTVRFYCKHQDMAVKAYLGMTPVSMGLHSLLRALPPLRAALERSGASVDAPRKNSWPYIARQIAYQYHYVSGIKRALREGLPASP
ncbi:MAG: hypothetical protein DLM53_02245 [Candidatus Eremiobacter antarcticus]|nr:glycosyltransferase [Candidatus Eremiobacteraeota bacterium]MBC5808229.1 glycosyltransferase [Candidatus Eremiobacteraeota bacterium]PZR63614.1 MAG: hypothetical protein DLM53_02245 [Candidatus Eremiobacter sp. RRmetagenome_bin22]